ncbi:MAG: hypothetical protein KJ069_03040 [Anaerolineae bacterium]|nr:hypothetical protein [Anaerolineae bacterium]
MADVYTVTFIIIGILLSVPALLVAFNLLMPQVTQRAYTRLDQTPVKSFFLGLPVTGFIVLYSLVAFQASAGLLQTTAFIVAIGGLGIGSIGGAGMARLLAARLTPLATPNSKLTNLLRGAVLYEMACLVPFVGWFLFIPIAGITAIGAATFALLGWVPRPVIGNQLSVIGGESAA